MNLPTYCSYPVGAFVWNQVSAYYGKFIAQLLRTSILELQGFN